ncbi:hypothetical protein LTR17_012105 [Elasticomyces elasticus]|nr:hypothetical protein LTR17_012105 [Elasticomyces elasticus]
MCPILRVRREVLVAIVGYLVRDGKVIGTKSKRVSAKRRKMDRELGRLMDPDWKPERRSIYTATAIAFYSSNTFKFREYEKLHTFLEYARPEALSCITPIKVGKDYHEQQWLSVSHTMG